MAASRRPAPPYPLRDHALRVSLFSLAGRAPASRPPSHLTRRRMNWPVFWLLSIATAMLPFAGRLYEGAIWAGKRAQRAGIVYPEKRGDSYVLPSGAAALDHASLEGRLHLALCATGRYKKEGDELLRVLKANFPSLPVAVDSYPVPPARMAVSRCLSALQGFTTMMALFGPPICEALGMVPVPPAVAAVNKHRLASILVTWFGGNALNSFMLHTAAFELYYDGHLVWSTLAEGYVPAMEVVVRRLQKAAPEHYEGYHED